MEKIALRESKNDHLIEELLKDPLYRVDKDGTIHTRLTVNGQGVSKNWRQVGYQKPDGYVRFRYKGEFLFIQRVVYRAFKGPLKKNMTINHIDLDRSNNSPDNLEMVTQGDNNKKKRKKYKKASLIRKVIAKLSPKRMTDHEFESYKKEFDKLNSSQMKAIGNLRRKHNMSGTLEDIVRDFRIALHVKNYGVFVSIKPATKWISYEITNRGKLIKDDEV